MCKCPKCERLITTLNLDPVDLHVTGGNSWKGNAYSCPWCNSVLSATIDQLAVKIDTIAELKKLLQR
jgi:hypothetical protein